MPRTLLKIPQHFGPEPHHGAGPEMAHLMIHERAIGKTIAKVYLGECEPLPELPQSEYVLFEFTDGTALLLEVASGYSFWVGTDKEIEKLRDLFKARAKAKGQA